jgi:hypothetical protein
MRIPIWLVVTHKKTFFIIVGLNILSLLLILLTVFLLDFNLQFSGLILFLFSMIVIIYMGVLYLVYMISKNAENKIRKIEDELAQKEMLLKKSGDIPSPEYMYEELCEVFDFNESGDTSYTRKCTFRFQEDSVYWAIMSISLYQGEGIRNLDSLRITAEDTVSNHPLKWIPIFVSRDKVKLAIILDEKVDENNPRASIKVSLLWEGLYKPLVEKFTDFGSSSIINPIDNYTILFIAPPSLEFINFRISPDIGEYKIYKQDDRSTIEFSGKKVSPGKYTYWLNAKPKVKS